MGCRSPKETVMQKTWTWSTTGYSLVRRTPDEIIDLCVRAGLRGIEAAPTLFAEVGESEQQRIAARFGDAGVVIDSYHLPFAVDDDITSFYETIRRQAVDRMLRHMERAALLGCRVVIQHPSTNRFDVELEGLDMYLRQMARSMAAMLPRAGALGLTVAVENMLPDEIVLPGTRGIRLCSRPEHFTRLASEFAHPGFGFCLDTGHALVAGGLEGAHAFFDAMAPRLAAFHLADNAGDRDSHLAPGHGRVDWDALFRAAAVLGYAHSMCIEAAPFAPGPNLTQSVEAWVEMVEDTETLVSVALG
jgi:sugar phosphate isomerase/epimerase